MLMLRPHLSSVVVPFVMLPQMQADDFRYDLYGLVTGLRDGGYSDDMTLAAIAGKILLFPHA